MYRETCSPARVGVVNAVHVPIGEKANHLPTEWYLRIHRMPTATSVTYYDLSGRKVQNPKHGVFVKKTVMSDGKVKTGKMVVE